MAVINSTAYSLGNQSATHHIECPKSVNPGPNAYAITGDGDCLLPMVRTGDTLVCDPDQTPAPGDLVVIWWKGGACQPLVKRLVVSLPPKTWWNMRGEASFVACVEMLNPPLALDIPLSRIEAVHKIIHVIRK
jgi:hypothetical protein